MSVIEIIVISVAIAMDAFAVSVCKGLSMKSFNYKYAMTIALYFGVFQAVMPIIGFCLGTIFSGVVENIDHWIAFLLLSIIGINMIKESKNEMIEKKNEKLNWKTMVALSVATSIDALAVGITVAFIKTDIVVASSMIGFVAFVLSFVGVIIRKRVRK